MVLFGNVISLIRGKNQNDKDAKINGIRTSTGVAYSTDGINGHFLDVTWSTEHAAPIPAVIYFNGSAFDRSNRQRSRMLCGLIAKRGYLVVNAEFRELGKNVGIEDEIEDVQKIVVWISANRKRFGIDTDNVYVLGSTYGALMALWTAMMYNSHRLEETAGLECINVKIKGLGLFNGMTDLYGGDTRMRNIGTSFRSLEERNPQLAHALDAWNNHDLRDMPPVFQATSVYDSARTDAVKLDKLLENNGIPHETVTFEGNERTLRSFMEKTPRTNEASRVISRMFTFFEDSQ